MRLFKTVDDEAYIRIEDEGGAAVTLCIRDDVADIAAILVPERDRRKGIGSALLKAAETAARDRGAAELGADFPADIAGMKELFTKAGFIVKDNVPLIAVDTGKLLEAPRVKKLLKETTEDACFISFEEFSLKQWDELFKTFSEYSVRLSSADIKRYSRRMSGAVFDSEGAGRAFILTTEEKDGLNIDLLLSAKKRGRTYVLEALQGMLTEVYLSGGAKRYPRITALCTNEKAAKLLDVVHPDDREKAGMAVYAVKELVGKDKGKIAVEDARDEVNTYAWCREIAAVPMQHNIGWKAAWYRETGKHEALHDKAVKDIRRRKV